MLWTAPGMVLSLVLASVSFHFLTLKTGGDLVSGHGYPTSWAAIVLLAMIAYVASYATGLGNVPWQQGELFALDGELKSQIDLRLYFLTLCSFLLLFF